MAKERKALVISPQPFFSSRGTPFSVYYRTLLISELGFKVDLVTYGEGQDVDIPGLRIIRIPRFRFLGSVRVGPSILKLFLDLFILFWTIGLLLKNRYDFVHAHEEAVFFCRFLKPIFRFKLIYDMHSSLPQQLTNFKFTKSKFLIGIFKKLEDSCLHAADAVITICPDLENYVKKLNLQNGKHILIENSIFEPVKLKKNRPVADNINSNCLDLGNVIPSGKRLIVYAGTLEPYQGIDILIQAFRKVVLIDPSAFLLILGGNEAQVKYYSDLAETMGLNEYSHFTGRVSQQLAKQYSSLASVLVSPRSDGTNTPLKIYEQIASGIPLVATNIYSHTQVLNDKMAILVDPKPKDMAYGIIKALNSAGNIDCIASNAKRVYEQNYSRPIYEAKMRRVIEALFLCAG